MTRARTLVGVLMVVAVLAGCGGSSPRVDAFTVYDAWARPTPPGAVDGVVYLDAVSPTDDAIVGASVAPAIAADAQLHESMAGTAGGHHHHGGEADDDESMTSMQPLDRVDLRAGDRVSFAPGGRHIMLVGLTGPLVEGAVIPVVLRLASGAEHTVDVPVRTNAP